jgi:hypothetical protein
VASKHPTLWKLIEVLRNESTLGQQKMDAHQAGAPSTSRKPAYKDLDNRLLTVVGKYEETDPIDYLRGVASNIRLA